MRTLAEVERELAMVCADQAAVGGPKLEISGYGSVEMGLQQAHEEGNDTMITWWELERARRRLVDERRKMLK